MVFKSKGYLLGLAFATVLNLSVLHCSAGGALLGIAFSLGVGELLFRAGVLKVE